MFFEKLAGTVAGKKLFFLNVMLKKVGLTGLNAAGKGMVADILAEYGYHCFSLSDLVREKAESKGLELARDNLIRVGNSLREKGGPGILAEMILDRLDEYSVIDSIRNPEEVNVLRTLDGFILLGIKAHSKVRFERMLNRGRFGDPVVYEDFIKKEEIENSDKSTGQQLYNCLEMADQYIDNNGGVEELRKNIISVCSITEEKRVCKNG